MGPLLDSAEGVCFAYFIPVYNVQPNSGVGPRLFGLRAVRAVLLLLALGLVLA